MYYNKTYHISDYLNVQDMNDLVDKVENLVGEMSTGANLFNRATANENYCFAWASGALYSETGSLASDYIPTTKGTQYRTTYSSQVMYYDSNKEYLGCLQTGGTTIAKTTGNAWKIFTTPNIDEIAYMRLGIRKGSDGGEDKTTKNIMLNKGSTLLPYEPYMQILPPSHYDLDLPTYELNDFVFVEDIDKIERNIMNIGYDFFQPPGYIQNKIWRNWYETDVYKSFGADDLNRMITDMNLLYEYYQKWYSGELRFPIYNLYSDENWDGNTTLEWE